MEAVPLGRPKIEPSSTSFLGSKLSLYQVPPKDNVSLEEFELYAIERLRVLKDVENISIRGLSGSAFSNRMSELVKAFPLNTPEGQTKDCISHWTLRFAYCQPDDRYWLVRQETDLFRYRLDQIGIDSFLKHNKMHFERVTDEEFSEFRAELQQLTDSLQEQKKAKPSSFRPVQREMVASDFYKIDFEQALELVKTRKGFLHKGSIFLHTANLVSIIIGRFKSNLTAGLETAFKAFPHMKDDERVGPLITKLPKQYIGKDWSKESTGTTVTPKDLDMLSQRSYPMCMRVMHEKLRHSHHLKNTARMHYGLFLKGIGLSLEDAIQFWRSELTRTARVPPEKFDKEYAYSIRHSYGKEGKKESYTPYSCVKIINQLPGHDEDHGCPFRYFTKESLVSTLGSYGCSGAVIEEILEEVEAKRWGHACRLYFQAKHDGYTMNELVINHPQQYFTHSVRFYNGKAGSEDAPAQQGNSN